MSLIFQVRYWRLSIEDEVKKRFQGLFFTNLKNKIINTSFNFTMMTFEGNQKYWSQILYWGILLEFCNKIVDLWKNSYSSLTRWPQWFLLRRLEEISWNFPFRRSKIFQNRMSDGKLKYLFVFKHKCYNSPPPEK